MSIRPELRRELLTLTPDERQELADELYDSLVKDSVTPEWEQEWGEELRQRSTDVIEDRVQLLDADEVHAGLRDELRDRQR